MKGKDVLAWLSLSAAFLMVYFCSLRLVQNGFRDALKEGVRDAIVEAQEILDAGR